MILGTLRIDEVILPVIDIRLIRGGFRIQAIAWGPITACSGNIRLFSKKGEPVTENAHGRAAICELPDIRAGDSVTVTYDVNVETFFNKDVSHA